MFDTHTPQAITPLLYIKRERFALRSARFPMETLAWACVFGFVCVRNQAKSEMRTKLTEKGGVGKTETHNGKLLQLE